MTSPPLSASNLKLVHSNSKISKSKPSLSRLMGVLGITDTSSSEWIEKLPFVGKDATAGSETELQTAVIGPREKADLPLSIERSKFFKNIAKQTSSGEAPLKRIAELEEYLDAKEEVWENSWVRFSGLLLNTYAQSVLGSDMRADKRESGSPMRCDAERFTCTENGERMIRIPVSYLLKLALADATGGADVPTVLKDVGAEMMALFLNDNTSPETHSFHPVTTDNERGLGGALAAETMLRYLLTQLLVGYANQKFLLERSGQKVIVYFAPNPPVRQKELNELISDSFYRELYMSPCLSGWDCGEEKHRYMALCHEVLSRSQLNTLSKLKEAGIISNNLVVLPNTSNISLANNGTHISFGSKILSRHLKDPLDGYGAMDEKYYGDLVIKITEHFLPLFVGTYSAAPYRLDFWDFHPERALGFLPHELDYTHLRMLWRRWKGKASLKFLGHPITPFGPEWLDRTISRLLDLKGDYVNDYRLLDYLIAILSTDESPSLNGRLGNDIELRSDLQDMGVFHRRMPLYLLYRMRQHQAMGFSGYEARYFSLFESITDDMSAASDLQLLITVLAYKYILQNTVTHQTIPDNPTVESERRQFFFGSAIGIPTYYVSRHTTNQFLMKIVHSAERTRSSRRYAKYIRIPAIEYRRALLRIVKQDGRDLIELLQLQKTVENLELRVNQPKDYAVDRRLTRKIMSGQSQSDPLKMKGREFNRAAETYYRKDMRLQHIREAFEQLETLVKSLDSWGAWRSGRYNKTMLRILDGKSAENYLASISEQLLDDALPAEEYQRLIHLMLLVFYKSKTEMEGDQVNRV